MISFSTAIFASVLLYKKSLIIVLSCLYTFACKLLESNAHSSQRVHTKNTERFFGGVNFILNSLFFLLPTERTEKIPMGSIKNVVSEPIEDHDEYHMMVRDALLKSS